MTELVGDKKEPFGVSNPHPAYGKDENIANEMGHTVYPRYIHQFDDKGKITASMIVANEAEEDEAEGFAAVWVKPKAEKPKAKANPFDKP